MPGPTVGVYPDADPAAVAGASGAAGASGGERSSGQDVHDPVSDARRQAAAAWAEVRAAGGALAKARAYAAHWASARAASASVLVRNVVLLAGLGVVALVAAAGLIAAAAALVVVGLAQGLALLFDGRLWAGNLVAGLLVLGLILIGGYLAISALAGGSKRKTEQAYAERHRRQREEYGQDVHEAARRAPADTRPDDD